ELTGVSAATMLGKGDYEYALPFYGERRPILLDLIFEPDAVIEQKYSHIVRDNDALIAETTLSHLHGREVTLFGKASPLYNTHGDIVGAIEAIRDITDRKKAEDELRAAYEQITASEEELRGQLDTLEESEQRIKENASRLRFMLGFYDRADEDKKDLLNFAVDGAGTITSSPLGYLAFLNDDESELSMYAWSKSTMKECSLQEKPLVYKTAKTGLWGEAVRQRKPVITNDYAAPSSVKKGYPPGHPEIIRHMNIPVLDGGHVVMVAGVANKSQAYTEDDVEQLSLLMQGLWQALQQRQIKQELYESEENYRTILNNIQDIFYRSDTLGNLVMASPSITELLGYDSLNEVIGKNIAKEFWSLPEQRQKFIDELEKHGSVKNFEAVLRRKDGRTITVATSSHFYYAKDGSVAGTEGIFHDVTVIRAADQQIHLLASLIDLSPASITVHDSEGRFLYANQRAFDLHGYTREEFMALNLHKIDIPASEELINQRITSFKQTGIVSFDVEHFRKDGSHLPLHVMAQMTRWMDREVILSVASDRSERIIADRILFEREEQYRKLFEQSNDAIFVADPKTRTITDCNRKAELITGYSRSEIIGMPVATLHPEDVRAVTMEHFQKFLQGMTNSVESALLTRDGRRVEVSVNAGPVEVGGHILLIGTFRDITEQKRVEDALRGANLKLNLLSSITRHDLTNQLTILQGYAQIAAMEKNNPFMADYLARIINSANIMARQIEFTRMYQELG
ncbi:MAG: hypothetical protein CVV34_01940, partial [Methanomicrobiales archaeon HGW-Methanomicrobiales-5]